MSVPLKKERERCWNFRDKYWKCLDKNNDDKEKCLEMRKEFENYCSKQWVQHFDRKRDYEKFKAKAGLSDWDWPESKKK